MIAPRTTASKQHYQVLKRKVVDTERLHDEMQDNRIRQLLEARLHDLKEQAAAFER